MRKYTYGFSALVLIVLAGCAALGLPVPDTFNEKLAAGYSTVTSVRTTATALIDAGTLKTDDAMNVLEQTNNAREGLDIARQIHASDPDGANSKLSSVLIGLNALQVYLKSRSD